MRLLIQFIIPLAVGAFLYWNWDGSPPVVVWPSEQPEVVGRHSPLSLTVTDSGKGLARLSATVVQGSNRYILLTESYTRSWVPWQAGMLSREITLDLSGISSLQDGPFSVEIRGEDHPNLWVLENEVVSTKTFELDLTPPDLTVTSQQHTLHQGGSEAIRYRLSPDAAASGVKVGDRVFQGYRLPESDTPEFVCIFALAYNAPLQTPVVAWAADRVGNRVEIPVQIFLRERQFRHRRLTISDTFIDKVALEIIRQTGLTTPDTQLERFLLVNDTLRQQNNAQIEEINKQSSHLMLWREPFVQLSNSQVESAFADERTYYYGDAKVDEQTHFGFDLASVAQGPVEAGNDGVVLYADYLGIYGNCVMVDHGFGLMSLYAHLSRIDVEPGQTVRRGQVFGRTGQTGLAGGDHLHFSIYVQGVAVTPMEWWDAKWVQNHILSRIQAAES